MYFRDNYQSIPALYNLLVHMLWRHEEEVDLDKVKVVHFCAAVSISPC
jgi:inositol 3-alpha-galactosyltransferase